MSLNSSIYVSYSGMSANQTGLTVVSENMTNVDTVGYSRRQVNTSGIYSQSTYKSRNIGSGVEIQEIKRVSDQFLRESYRETSPEMGYWDTQNRYLYEVESSYGNIYGETIQTTGDDFFNSWEELSKDPTDQAARGLVYEEGVSFCDSVNDIEGQISSIEKSCINELYDTVDTINSISSEIASINGQISKYPDGQVPLELIDYRENLLDDLSLLVDCDRIYKSDGTVDVISNNGILVSHDKSKDLQVLARPPKGMPEVVWENGNQYDNDGGSLGALTDLLNTETSPSFEETRNLLNDAVLSIVNEINNIHSSGHALDGSTGIDYFIPINPDEPMGIGNLQVNPILEDTNKIAASSTDDFGNGDLAYDISELQNGEIVKQDDEMVTIDDFFAYYNEFLGSQTKHAEFKVLNQKDMRIQIENEINSVSSVSLDDEMANMVVYQQAYNANLNVMNIVDELIGDIIQKMG